MSSKIPQEIHNLVPEELRDNYGIYWSARSNRYYVYRDLGYVYDPKIKRSRARRQPLGNIKDHVFSYSPSWLSKQKIKELTSTNKNLQKRVEKSEATQSGELAPETQKAAETLKESIRDIADPRQQEKTQYPLSAILMVALLASFTGNTSAVSIAIYWRMHAQELAQIIDDFPLEAPSHDTINRVLRLIDSMKIAETLRRLATPLAVEANNRLLHIDGQAVRASKTPDSDMGRYLFNVYDSSNMLVVTHKLINEKKNEISSSIELLSAITLRAGDIVTADAMNTQKKLVAFLQERGVDYCLAVKENHPKLYREAQHLFAVTDLSRFRTAETLDADHGRIETRRVAVLPASLLSKEFLEAWPGLADGCIIRVTNICEAKSKRARNSTETRYFISSLRYTTEDIAALSGTVVRRHWHVENSCHWHLDCQFDQDRIQCTNENYLTNRVALNKIGLNALKTAQRVFATRNQKYSIKTLQTLCSSPAGALETLAMGMDIHNIVNESKA